MSERFDPYHRWLAISPEEQPADHYRLLGCKTFEDDLDVIESAADRQMSHVRGFQSGEHADDAQKILNEISAAKLVLLKPAEKQAYDDQLKAQQQPKTKKVREPKMAQALPLEQPAPPTAAPPTAAPPTPVPVAASPAPAPTAADGPAIRTRVRKRKSGSSVAILGGAVVLLMLIAVVGIAAVALVVRPWETNEVAHNDGNAPLPPAVVPPVNETADSSSTDAEEPADGSADDGSADDGNADATDPPPAEPADGEEDSATPPDEPNENDPPGNADVHELEEQPPAPEKHAIPASDLREASRTRIESIFLLKDADTLDKRIAIINELMKIAAETTDDPATQFELLNWAREIAADNAQVRLAMKAIDRLEETFDFEATSVRRATLGEAINSPVPPADKKEVLAVGIEMMDEMIERDEYDTAGKLAVALLDLARRVRDRRLLDEVVDRRTRAEEFAKQFRQVQAALATLESDPANAEASLTAGRFYLLAKNDWAGALPLLVQSGDALLAAAAQGEIDEPATTADEEALAKAWWDAAEAETDKAAKAVFYARSMAWYKRAAPKLRGIQQAAAEQRLQKLADAGVRPLDSITMVDRSGLLPGSTLPYRTWIDVLQWTNVLKGGPQPWIRDGEEVISSSGGKGKELRLPLTVAGSYELHVDATVETRGGIVFVIPVGSRCVNLSIGPSDWTLQWVNGKNRNRSLQNQNFRIGERVAVTVTVQVSEDGSTATISYAIGGTTIGSWTGNPSALSGWGGKTARPPTVAGWDARIRFHTASFRLLSGRAILHEDAVLHGVSARPRPRPDTTVVREDSSLIAHWTFDDGRGPLARDEIGGNHGTVEGGAAWTTGVRGGALSFDGQDDVVMIPADAALDVSGNITMAAWVRAKTLPRKMGNKNVFTFLLTHADPKVSTFIRYVDRGNGTDYSVGVWNAEQGAVEAKSSARADANQWVHIAGVYDGTSWRIYRNGALAAREESTRAAPSSAAGWKIGGIIDPKFPFRFHGDIDDVRIYNRALSPEEVGELANADESVSSHESLTPPKSVQDILAKGCIALYTFERDTFGQVDGKPIVGDQSGTDSHGNLAGGTYLAKGQAGGALVFDGKDDYISLKPVRERLLGGPTRFSIAGWCKILPKEKGPSLLFTLGENPKNGIACGTHGEFFRLVACADVGGNHVNTPWPDDDQWHHFAATMDERHMQMFLDGELKMVKPHSIREFNTQTLSKTGGVRLGGQAHLYLRSERFFRGTMDEIAIFSRPLSAAEVKLLYEAGKRGEVLSQAR